jgi:NADH:ubiquinone oxidoreductase subunit D
VAREVRVGPPARASNVAIDARLDHPYAAYDEIVRGSARTRL